MCDDDDDDCAMFYYLFVCLFFSFVPLFHFIIDRKYFISSSMVWQDSSSASQVLRCRQKHGSNTASLSQRAQ